MTMVVDEMFVYVYLYLYMRVNLCVRSRFDFAVP